MSRLVLEKFGRFDAHDTVVIIVVIIVLQQARIAGQGFQGRRFRVWERLYCTLDSSESSASLGRPKLDAQIRE